MINFFNAVFIHILILQSNYLEASSKPQNHDQDLNVLNGCAHNWRDVVVESQLIATRRSMVNFESFSLELTLTSYTIKFYLHSYF